MRFYGKKFLGHSIREKIVAHKETRDAILWDVLPDQRLCEVKIQSSNKKIVAYYPENWEKTPFWLKPGNAVRITHKGGIRGRIELVGHGLVIPTPVSGDTLPTPETPPDAVMTGCLVGQVPNDPRLSVMVDVGTYRIGGTTYTLGEISMLYGDNFELGDGGSMEDVAGVVNLNAAPSVGYFRYDLISVGADGVIDYAAGTPVTSDPVKPTVASNHLALAYILVYGGMTQIFSSDIYQEWTTPAPASITVVPADNDLAWAELSTEVVVSVFDQYGNPVTTTGYGWYMTLEIIQGNGSVSSPEEGSSTSKIGGHTGSENHYHFTYTRDQLPTDESVVLTGICEINFPLSGTCYITLRDALGDPM